MTVLLIIIAVCYLLIITYLHHKIMQLCTQNEAIPDDKRVLGVIHDTRPNNLINRALK